MTAAEKKPRVRPGQERRCIKMAIPPSWQGQTCVLIASGPSLTQAQVNTAKTAWAEGRCTVMGCNDAYRVAPWMNGLYAGDGRWWDYHIENVRKTHIPLLFSQHQGAAEKYGLWHTPGIQPNPHGPGISLDPQFIKFGFNSGFQVFNIAVHLLSHSARIILIGYDYCWGPGGKRHWFGDHPKGFTKAENIENWATCYESAVDQLKDRDIEVINCSPPSKITAFPKSTIGAVLGC